MTKARMLLDRQYTFLPWIAGGAWLFAGLVSLAREKPTHLLDAWMLVPITLTYVLLLRFAKERHANLPRYSRLLEGVGVAPDLPVHDPPPHLPGLDPVHATGRLLLEGILDQSPPADQTR